MNIKTRNENEVAIVSLDGRFDAQHASTVKAQIMHLVDSESARLVINLAGFNFIDSAGLAVFVQAMKRCREASGELRLCHLQSSVVAMLEMSGLDKILALHETEQAAINAFYIQEVETA